MCGRVHTAIASNEVEKKLLSETNYFYCVDVDECTIGMDDCDVNAECINEQGSFLCQCRDGYTGDGKICEGILYEC